MANSSNSDSGSWRQRRKIVRLPGVVLTPEAVAASTLEMSREGLIKSVVVAIQWEDGTVDLDWSNMKADTATWMAKHIDKWILDLISGRIGDWLD